MAVLEVGVNSYATVAEADDYLSLRHGADAWWAAHEAVKAQALVTATRRIDMQFLVGRKATAAQTLAFPRLLWSGGQWVTVEATWLDVLAAACEEALTILSRSERQARIADGVTSVRIGDASESYDPAAVARASGGWLISAEARQLLDRYMARAVRIT